MCLNFAPWGFWKKYRAAAPRAYKRFSPSGQFVGWWQSLVSFVIAIYYAAVIVWAGSYMVFSFGQKWGEDTTNFFVSDFIQHTGELTSVFVPQMFTGLVIVWALALLIMFGGIRKGVYQRAEQVTRGSFATVSSGRKHCVIETS